MMPYAQQLMMAQAATAAAAGAAVTERRRRFSITQRLCSSFATQVRRGGTTIRCHDRREKLVALATELAKRFRDSRGRARSQQQLSFRKHRATERDAATARWSFPKRTAASAPTSKTTSYARSNSRKDAARPPSPSTCICSASAAWSSARPAQRPEEKLFWDAIGHGKQIIGGGISEPETGGDWGYFATKARKDGDYLRPQRAQDFHQPLARHRFVHGDGDDRGYQSAALVDVSDSQGHARAGADRDLGCDGDARDCQSRPRHQGCTGARDRDDGIAAHRTHRRVGGVVVRMVLPFGRGGIHRGRDRGIQVRQGIHLAIPAAVAAAPNSSTCPEFSSRLPMPKRSSPLRARFISAPRATTFRIPNHLQGEAGLARVVLAKYVATNNAIRAVDQMMEIVGAHGYLKKFPMERYFRDVRAGVNHPLSNARARELIGKSALGIGLGECRAGRLTLPVERHRTGRSCAPRAPRGASICDGSTRPRPRARAMRSIW